jgi:hypothetical protein
MTSSLALIRIKAGYGAAAIFPAVKEEFMHPFLILVVAAFAIFIGVLGFYSLRQSFDQQKKR